jgi:uncharacterized protein (DUF2236 family)
MTAPTPVSEPDATYRETPVAERPLVRQVAERRVWPVFLFRALAMQGMHPTIMAGIEDHSTFFDDPMGRRARTLSYAYRMFFGESQQDTAQEIRELHRDIKGTGYNGRPYHAWNREAWTWVHLTAVEAMIYALSVSFWPLHPGDVEAFYQQGRQTGLLYGVRDQDMPTDLAGLHDYISAGIDNKLVRSPGSDRLQKFVNDQSLLAAASLPRQLRAVLEPVVRQPAFTLAFGAFPQRVRDLWGIKWTRRRQGEYVWLLATIRALSTPLPDRQRMVPDAYRALCGQVCPAPPMR